MNQRFRPIAHGKLNFLIVDDDEGDRKQLRRALKQAVLDCDCVETGTFEEALAACHQSVFDCAFIDYRMPGYDGLHGIATLHRCFPFMSIIMATGQGDEMVATEAIKLGASDYIAKAQINVNSVGRSVESTLEKAALRRKVAQQREELENFARVLVHDLSAPIASMQLFARVIEEDLNLETLDRQEIIDNCREIAGAGRRLGALIDTLYEYTRADAAVAFGTVEMREVMENTLSNLKPAIQRRGARVSCDALPAVNGNSPQLLQLLQNLIGNAIKYCEAATPTVHVSASQGPGNTWLFSVKDNGIGIPEQDYQQVFEPFRRLATASEYEGTGLGLATCKKIVERHHGIIRCESKISEGTMFFFTLQGATRL